MGFIEGLSAVIVDFNALFLSTRRVLSVIDYHSGLSGFSRVTDSANSVLLNALDRLTESNESVKIYVISSDIVCGEDYEYNKELLSSVFKGKSYEERVKYITGDSVAAICDTLCYPEEISKGKSIGVFLSNKDRDDYCLSDHGVKVDAELIYASFCKGVYADEYFKSSTTEQ